MNLKKSALFKNANSVVSSLCAIFVKTIDFRKEQQDTPTILKAATVFQPSFSHFHAIEKPYWIHFNAIKGTPHFIIPIPNAQLISKGIVLNEQGTVILENCIFQQEYLDELYSNHLVKLRGLLPSQHVNKIISLGNRLDNNYFHWATESLTRLLLVCELAIFKEYKIVIKAAAQPFIKESLFFLFDVDDTRLIEKSLSRRLKTKETLVVSFPHVRTKETLWTNVYDPWVLQALNQRALERIKKHPIYKKEQPQCILISRKNALERRIVNEDEVLVSLKSYGVQMVRLELLSYMEQVALFAKTKVIIGVHGAGLTNCLYCENATLIEYFPKERNRRDGFYFTQITGAIKMNHHFSTYPEVNPEGDLLLNEMQLSELKLLLDTII